MISINENNLLKPGRPLYESPTLSLFYVENGEPQPGRFLVTQSPALSEEQRLQWEKEAKQLQSVQKSGNIPFLWSSTSWDKRVWTTFSFFVGVPVVQKLHQAAKLQRMREILNISRQFASFAIAANQAGFGVEWDQLLEQSLCSPEGKLIVLPSFLKEYLSLPPWSCVTHLLIEKESVKTSAFCDFLRKIVQQFGPAASESDPIRSRLFSLLDRFEKEETYLLDVQYMLDSFYASSKYDAFDDQPRCHEKARQRKYHFISASKGKLFLSILLDFMKKGMETEQSLQKMKQCGLPKQLQKVIDRVKRDIARGNQLSLALSRFPEYFSDSVIVAVRLGEKEGQVKKALRNALTQMEEQNRLQGEVYLKLARPAAIWTVIFVGLSYAIQSAGKNAPIPPLLASLIHEAATFGRFPWILFYALSFFTWMGILFEFIKPDSIFSFLEWKYRIPLLGRFIENFLTLQSLKFLQLLLSLGMDPEEALKTVKNMYFSKKLKNSYGQAIFLLRQGFSLHYVCHKLAGISTPVSVDGASAQSIAWYAALLETFENGCFHQLHTIVDAEDRAASLAVGGTSLFILYITIVSLKAMFLS